jgi:peptidoglycan/LPS O-acetylase OafA/YrhL
LAKDYAIIARIHDRVTGQPVIIIAGILGEGTEAASEVVIRPAYLDEMLKRAPQNWDQLNLEAVIETHVIEGHAGPPTVLAVTLLLAYLASLLLIPSPSVQNRVGETYTLNSPSWSLTQEYLANVGYALVLRRLRTRTLAIIAVLSGSVLLWEAIQRGSLDAGWGYRNFWMAPIRLAFPFVAGLWLDRVYDRLPHINVGFLPLTAVLLAAFMIPVLPKLGSFSCNGFYDALCVLVVFPVILIAGANSRADNELMRICKFSGRLSYPLYMTHYPFMYVYANWVETKHPAQGQQIYVALLLAPFVIFFAWIAVKFFDEPIRIKLRRYGFEKGTRTSRSFRDT